ncbi:MAG: peptidase M28, partial [Candidatus Rokubacteria bacterium CSP1-6]
MRPFVWTTLTALTLVRSLGAQTGSIAERYRAAADRIIDAALGDSAAYHRLAILTDRFGPRFSGTDNLERAIDWILEEMRKDGLDHVRG